MTWANMYYLDTWGHRKAMILGMIGVGVGMLLIDVVLKTEGNPAYSPTSHKVKFNFKSNEAAGRAVITFIYLHVASFAIWWEQEPDENSCVRSGREVSRVIQTAIVDIIRRCHA